MPCLLFVLLVNPVFVEDKIRCILVVSVVFTKYWPNNNYDYVIVIYNYDVTTTVRLLVVLLRNKQLRNDIGR